MGWGRRVLRGDDSERGVGRGANGEAAVATLSFSHQAGTSVGRMTAASISPDSSEATDWAVNEATTTLAAESHR